MFCISMSVVRGEAERNAVESKNEGRLRVFVFVCKKCAFRFFPTRQFPSCCPCLLLVFLNKTGFFFAPADNKVTTQLLVLIKTGCTPSWVVIFLLPARSEISLTKTQNSMFFDCSYPGKQYSILLCSYSFFPKQNGTFSGQVVCRPR